MYLMKFTPFQGRFRHDQNHAYNTSADSGDSGMLKVFSETPNFTAYNHVFFHIFWNLSKSSIQRVNVRS